MVLSNLAHSLSVPYITSDDHVPRFPLGRTRGRISIFIVVTTPPNLKKLCAMKFAPAFAILLRSYIYPCCIKH